MSQLKKSSLPWIAMAIVAVAGLAALISWPQIVSTTTYALETGRSKASQEQLATANDLSNAFQHVAKALRPSVVSVNSVKKVASRAVPQQRPELPPEFRRFFGDDDPFDRFFENAPREGRSFEQRGMGTGVIISRDGYIVTNNHVVAGATEVSVNLSDDREFTAEVVGTDKATDLAVLKIEATGLTPAKLGDSSALEVGEWAIAIGSPFGLKQTVTAGIISAVGRANVGIADYEDFVQTDAAINPGNSGGPLVNLHGEVIGINTAIASRTGSYMGVGFAIPSDMVRSVSDSLIASGSVQRGWLGAVIQDLNEDLADSFGYDGTDGVLIGDVLNDGPADNAGLKAGDIVISIDGEPTTSATELRNQVADISAGSKAKFRFFRDGAEKTLTVTIGKRQANPQLGAAPRKEESTKANELGVTVETLTDELAERIGAPVDLQGVVVTDLADSDIATKAGVNVGDVILSVNGKSVKNVKEFNAALSKASLTNGLRLQLYSDGVRRFAFVKVK